MSATERLLTAIVDIQHYIMHDIDPDKCAACPRWDELQGAAMEAVAEIGQLRERLVAIEDEHISCADDVGDVLGQGDDEPLLTCARRVMARAEKAEAEVERLRAGNERLAGCLKKANEQAEHFEREWYLRGDALEKAEAEVERLRADAERYRWLREQHVTDEQGIGHGAAFCDVCRPNGDYSDMVSPRSPSELDAAIDAARGES